MIYPDIVGSAAWDALSPVLHAMHERGGDGTLTITSRGFSRVFSVLGFLPSAGQAATTLRIEPLESGGERWIRSFNGEIFASTQRIEKGLIAERFGILEWMQRATARGQLIRYEPTTFYLRFGSIRLTIPPWMVPKVEATERADGHRVLINVAIGKSFRYAGALVPR